MAAIDQDKTWRDRLVRAKWRGFEFLTDSHDAKGGHRLVVHEFPGRDIPVVEDLGEKAPGHSLKAYFIGNQYDLERNKFLQLLRVKGPETLRHPYLGDLYLRVADWSVHDSSAQGGFGTVSVEFVAGGSKTIAPTVDVADTAFGRIREYQVTATAFEPTPMSAGELDTFVRRVQNQLDKVRDAVARARMPLEYANAALRTLDSVRTTLAEVLAVPGAYANAMNSLVGAIRIGNLSLGLGGYADELCRSRLVSGLVSVTKPATTQVSLGAVDSVALRRNLSLDSQHRAHWLVASAMELALADYGNKDARDKTLKAVIDAADTLLSQAVPTGGDALFELCAQSRAALIEGLRSQTLAPTQTRTVAKAQPAAVLAYRMGMNEADFMVRNAIAHPLFVQGQVYG